MRTREVAARLIATFGVVIAAAVVPVDAQQQNSITLSCNGTSGPYPGRKFDPSRKPRPITGLGIIVNFSEHTVSFENYTVPITSAEPALVNFDGWITDDVLHKHISGDIDRVTGHARVGITINELPEDNELWALDCRPATKLF